MSSDPAERVSNTLNNAVQAYEDAISKLPSKAESDSPKRVMRVLLARDNVAYVLSQDSLLSRQDLLPVIDLDEQLKNAAPKINQILTKKTLEKWRDSIQPQSTVWWWHLDERTAYPEPHPMWAVVTWLMLLIAFSIAIVILLRFLSFGTDAFSVVTTVLSISLTLLLGTSLTKRGSEIVSQIFTVLNIPLQSHYWVKFVMASLALGFVAIVWISLPSIGLLYNQWGVEAHQRRQLASAIDNYRRAVNLNSDAVQFHYNLATAYEDALDNDKAISEYQIALSADPQLYLAHNNLARLLILRQNFSSALSLLNAGLASASKFPATERDGTQYSLYKNRGWTNFELKNFSLAENDLQRALTLKSDGAAAHCVLAHVREAQSQRTEAFAEWEACVRFAPNELVEQAWVAQAQERLKQGAPK